MNKENALKIIKWIGVLPAIIVAYILSKILTDWGFNYVAPDVVYDVANFGGFGGHYILGPLYLFNREAVATGFAIFAGVYLAPKYKKYLYFLLAGLFIAFLIISVVFVLRTIISTWPIEIIMRYIIELSAEITGIVAAGFYIWEEAKKQDKSKIYGDEL